MAKQRYEITGEWSGPRNPAGDHTRLVHREYTTDEGIVCFVMTHGSILYTDGTMLILTARPMKKGERAGKTKDGYGKLIRDCARYGVCSVDALCKSKEIKEWQTKPPHTTKSST